MHYPTHHHQAIYNENLSHSSQQQSSCSQCKRNTNNIQQQSEQEESSLQVHQHRKGNNLSESSSQDGVSVPLRKNIVNKNYQFEEMLKLLQYEVNILKKENETKDGMIKELKFQVHKSAIEEERKMQNNKQLLDVNRLRQQLGCSPRNNLQNLQKSFKSSLNFQPNQVPKDYSISQQSYNMTHSFNPNTYHLQKQRDTQQEYLGTLRNNNTTTAFQSLQDYELRIAILEKQLRQYQLEMLQQKQQISKLQEETKWQQKFIHSFVKMCDELSLNYGQKLKLSKLGDDLKKKTKLSWNYMKDLVGYFVQVADRSEQGK